MKKLLTIVLILNLASAVVSGQTTIQGSFDHDGITRDYLLYVPAVYSHAKPAPLVINLHGSGSNALEQLNYSNFIPVADTAGFLVVQPNAIIDQDGLSNWNAFGNNPVDDFGFMSALIDTLAVSYSIDQARVYSTGMSMGGVMSYSLACFLSNRIAAIASVTGSMTPSTLNTCNPSRQVPMMQIHGTHDTYVPYNGNSWLVGIQNLINFWVSHNGCSTTPIVTQIPDIDTTDGCTAVHFLYPDGFNGATVEFYRVNMGGHTWPGAIWPLVHLNLGATNMDFNANAEVWRFLSQFDINGLITGIENPKPPSPQARIWPNPSSGLVNIMLEKEGEGIIAIYNTLGQLLDFRQTDGKHFTAELPACGMYMVVISQDGQQASHKVICK
jgi:polyhydroxybutyrate depolymerase